MRSARRLATLLVLATALAAVEAWVVRERLHWRPVTPALFLQALGLWVAFGLLAAVPAWLTLRLLESRPAPAVPGRRPARRGPWAPAVLLGWMLFPVVGHTVLDRYTGGGGDLSRLAAARPWLELAGATLALVLALALASRLLRRASGALLAGLVLVPSIVVGLYFPRSSAGPPVGADAAAAPEGAPNILFLVWDTCRADRLGLSGWERPTSPFLDALADESIVYDEARSVSVFTFTSHLSMLTGVYPSTHGAKLLRMRYQPERATLLSQLLREHGYRTGAFVGTDVLAGRTGIRWQFERYDDQVDPPVCDTQAWKLVHDVQTVLARTFPALRNNGQPHWIQDFQRPAEEVLEHALAWIREDDPRPWFCFVNLYDVHWPYVPAAEAARELVGPYDGTLDGYLFRSDRWVPGTEIGPEDRRHVSELYEAEIRELDDTVAGFLDALRLDRGGTAVLVTADHGEAFGERGEWKHEDLGEPQVRVPFLLRLPEPAPAGERRPGPVSGVDVMPTLLGLAGLEPPEGVEGVDLLEVDPPADRVLFVDDRDHGNPGDVRIAVYRGRYKLVRTGLKQNTVWELFDLATDPLGERDVQASHPEVFAELQALLQAHRAPYDEREAEVGAHPGEEADALQALGYLGGDGGPGKDEPEADAAGAGSEGASPDASDGGGPASAGGAG